MKRQQYFQHRLRTLNALHDAVSAMRSLSAHHFRQARSALAPARSYRDEIEQVIHDVGLPEIPQSVRPFGLLLITSDLGLCGDYSVRLSQTGLQVIDQHAIGNIYAVGRRSRGVLARAELQPVRVYPAPASRGGISSLLLELAEDLLVDYLEAKIGGLLVVAAKFTGVGHFQPQVTQLLPQPPSSALRPERRTPYVDSSELVAVVARESLYITLHEILLSAVASEHGMRLVAAESALEWLDSVRQSTSRRLTMAKSEAATQELLDIVAGGRKQFREDAAKST